MDKGIAKYLVEKYLRGEVAQVKTPDYVSDNIPVEIGRWDPPSPARAGYGVTGSGKVGMWEGGLGARDPGGAW